MEGSNTFKIYFFKNFFFGCTNAFSCLNFETNFFLFFFFLSLFLFLFFFPRFGANQIPNIVLDIWHLMLPNSVGSLRCWRLQTKLEWLSIPFSYAGALNASSSPAPTVHTEPPGSSTPMQRTPWVLCLVWYGLGQMCMLKNIAMRLSRERHPCVGETFQGSTSAPLVLIQLKNLGCNLGMH